MLWPSRGDFKSRWPVVGLLVILTTAPAEFTATWAEDKDYPQIFCRSYEKAVDFVRTQGRVTAMLRQRGVPPGFAWSIVFPELIRWSALSNIIETSNLAALYVQFGRGYSDFSVGRFQMKPSFAETLEKDFRRLIDPGEREAMGFPDMDASDTVAGRRARVKRLTDMEGQAVYLVMFIRVVEALHAGRQWPNEEEKLKFFAAAYNAGYRLPASRLKRETSASRFHLGLFNKPPYYCYAEIALDYFRRHAVSDLLKLTN